MKSAESEAGALAVPFDPALVGGVCCFLAAVIYAATNVCLRWMSAGPHPQWALCVKESVSVVLVGPWLLYLAAKGVRLVPSARVLGTLAVAGLATELGGNLLLLWAMGVIGLSVSIPLVVSCSLTTTAVLGRIWLKERVSYRSLLALAILILSVGCLGLGIRTAGAAAAPVAQPGVLKLFAAAVAACLAGACFALLAVGVRRSVTDSVRPAVVVVAITGIGTLTLGPWSLWQLGWKEIALTSGSDLTVMLLAGVLNLLAFTLYTIGLKFTTAVRGNLMNAAQTALAAVGGWLVFHEPLNAALIAGVVLTILGIALVDRPASEGAVVADV